jgi:hypothetical protein
MNEDINRKSNSLETLTISEVSVLLCFKNDLTTRKWLKDNAIQIHRLTKRSFVYQIELDFVLDKPYVMDLKRKHPQNWRESYRCVAKDKSLYDLMILEIDKEVCFTPTTKVSIKSKTDQKLFKSLVS